MGKLDAPKNENVEQQPIQGTEAPETVKPYEPPKKNVEQKESEKQEQQEKLGPVEGAMSETEDPNTPQDPNAPKEGKQEEKTKTNTMFGSAAESLSGFAKKIQSTFNSLKQSAGPAIASLIGTLESFGFLPKAWITGLETLIGGPNVRIAFATMSEAQLPILPDITDTNVAKTLYDVTFKNKLLEANLKEDQYTKSDFTLAAVEIMKRVPPLNPDGYTLVELKAAAEKVNIGAQAPVVPAAQPAPETPTGPSAQPQPATEGEGAATPPAPTESPTASDAEAPSEGAQNPAAPTTNP